jgi:hypothetical protein
MGISIFPSQGGGYTLQRVITTSGNYSLGAPTFCFAMMAGGGGGGSGASGGSLRGGQGGGGAGALGINLMLNSFHATIGAGGNGGASGNNGDNGGNTALTITAGNEGSSTGLQSDANVNSKQIVAMGGGAGVTSTSGGSPGNAPANVTVSNRNVTWILGSPGSSGPGTTTTPTFTGGLQTLTNADLYYLAAASGFIHNNSGTWYSSTPASGQSSGASYFSFIPALSANMGIYLNPGSSTYGQPFTNFASATTAATGPSVGGRGATTSGANASRGASGTFTAGGGGGSYTNTGRSGHGGGTSLYEGGGLLAGGGGGGGGAGLFGAGSTGTYISVNAGGNGGNGGLGGGGGGGGGGGDSTNSNGGAGGAGIMLIFF